jgi:hypothetical protein
MRVAAPGASRREHRSTQEQAMAKGKDVKKENDKKKPQKSLKEKRAAKQSKKG